MDPDQCLNEIRDLYEWITTMPTDSPSMADQADELAEKVNALDNWLSHGGALPKEWQTKTPTRRSTVPDSELFGTRD